MLPPLRYIFCSLALSSLCVVLSLSGAGAKVDFRLTRLDQLVALTPEQKIAAAQIFRTEDQILSALPAKNRAVKGTYLRQASRQQLRALLTPQQRNKYDLAP